MIKRIVKLTFRPERVTDFLSVFEQTHAQIRAFPGCQHLELWQDEQRPEVFFTYSFWEDGAALERYRQSELFRGTWARTKPLFGERAQAWSVRQLGS